MESGEIKYGFKSHSQSLWEAGFFAVISRFSNIVEVVLISPPFPLCGCSRTQGQILAFNALKASPGSGKASAAFRKACLARTSWFSLQQKSVTHGLSPSH